MIYTASWVSRICEAHYLFLNFSSENQCKGNTQDDRHGIERTIWGYYHGWRGHYGIPSSILILSRAHFTNYRQGSSLVWILYVLSQHPEWQARLREEIREADRAASNAGVDYDRLPFLNAIIKVSHDFELARTSLCLVPFRKSSASTPLGRSQNVKQCATR